MIIETDIETVRLRLSPLVVADAPALGEMTDHRKLLDAIHFLEQPFTPAAAERLLAGADNVHDVFLGGRLRVGGTLAAVVGVHLHDDDEFEIGYWVRPDIQGQGIAREAAGSVVSRLRASHANCRIVAECRRANEASWRLLNRLGFEATGRLGKRPGRERLVSSGAIAAQPV